MKPASYVPIFQPFMHKFIFTSINEMDNKGVMLSNYRHVLLHSHKMGQTLNVFYLYIGLNMKNNPD